MFGSGRVRAHGLKLLRSLVYTVEQPHYGEYLIGLLLLFLELLMPKSKMRESSKIEHYHHEAKMKPLFKKSKGGGNFYNFFSLIILGPHIIKIDNIDD